MAHARTHVVYLCYDEADRLLYVGMSSSPLERFEQHSAKRDWFALVATIRLVHCSSRYEAHVRELALIHELLPTHNAVGTEGMIAPLIPPGRYRKTHCLNGHPFDAENTYFTSSGARICKTCTRERKRAQSPTKRESAA